MKPLAYYKKVFRGCTFSNDWGEWKIADVMFAFQDLPVERVPIERLRRNLGNTTTDEPIDSEEFIKRAFKADCRYPILCFRERNGTISVMDGVHRLWKTIHCDRPTIAARIVRHSALKALR